MTQFTWRYMFIILFFCMDSLQILLGAKSRLFFSDELNLEANTKLASFTYTDVQTYRNDLALCAWKCIYTQQFCYAFMFDADAHICRIFQVMSPPTNQGISLISVNGNNLYTSYGK